MNNLTNIRQAYFAGIGGIGMSALAKLLHKKGIKVLGYDRTPSDITRKMEQMGISIHYNDDVETLKDFTKESTDQALVIITPAIPAGFGEIKYLLANGFFPLKRAELLGVISSWHRTMAVAGTHGKTTASCMMAWLMTAHPQGSLGILGGVSANFNENIIIPEGEPQWMVTEADEFDRSFLHLETEIAVITSTDADHLDIYKTHEQLLEAFSQFAEKVKSGGFLLTAKGVSVRKPKAASHYTYGLDSTADFYAKDLYLEGITHCFALHGPEGKIADLQLNMPGLHNVENAVAACASAWLAGLSADAIEKQMPLFKGVKRRFEFVLHGQNRVLIDDYAHHPTEIAAFLKGVRALYPNKWITAVFQPHLYSRTRDFANGFAESLSMADEVILLDIYPARELPIEGVSSEMILKNISASRKHLVSKSQLKELIEGLKPELLLTIGAGDIDRLVPELKILMEA